MRETTPPRGAISLEPCPAGARTGWTETVDASAKPLRQTPTLLGIAKPRERPTAAEGSGGRRHAGDIPRTTFERVASVAALATRESTGVAVGGDRLASASSEGKSDPGLQSKWLALGIVLAGVATAATLLSLLGGEPEGSLAVDRLRSQADGTGTLEVVAAALESRAAPPAAVALPTLPSIAPLPAAPAPTASLERASEPDEARGATAVAASSDRARAPRSGRLERLRASPRHEASAARRGANRTTAAAKKVELEKANADPKLGRLEPTHGTAPQRMSDRCNPPWVINEDQVKVFKAECLR